MNKMILKNIQNFKNKTMKYETNSGPSESQNEVPVEFPINSPPEVPIQLPTIKPEPRKS
jgi:ABC-type transporter MlaC component